MLTKLLTVADELHTDYKF